ncbi:Hypothetical predicted protein [Pelobates cultripes]|uniref:Uncharacterized protein n=1 Tax=Pelobates cultripes TaxID=61616 RepID=A0AAD1SDG5_PELCU|nr:Hypothetical predicted protein [Pelobates cultripes]
MADNACGKGSNEKAPDVVTKLQGHFEEFWRKLKCILQGQPKHTPESDSPIPSRSATRTLKTSPRAHTSTQRHVFSSESRTTRPRRAPIPMRRRHRRRLKRAPVAGTRRPLNRQHPQKQRSDSRPQRENPRYQVQNTATNTLLTHGTSPCLSRRVFGHRLHHGAMTYPELERINQDSGPPSQ